MNKVILGLILAVCVLGLALVMLNERLGRNSETQPVPVITEHRRPVTPTLEDVRPFNSEAEKPSLPSRPERTPEEILSAARELEEKEAEAALAAPVREIPEQMPPAESVKPAPRQDAAQKPGPEGQKPETRKPEPLPEPKQEQAPSAPKPAVQTPPKPESPTVQPPQPRQAEQPKPAKTDGKKTITRFVVFSREKGATIRVTGNGPLNYKSMILENPDRFVIDLDGDWQFPSNTGVPKNEFVNSLRVGKMGDKTRVVIDLKEKPRVSRVLPGKNGDSVDVRLDK